MKPLLTAAVYLAIAFRASHLDAATPIASDANSIILDHFDGSTKGTPFGGPSYSSSASGLNQAVNLNTGTFIQYPVPTSLETAGTIEAWVNLRSYGTGILNFNWNNTSSTPSAGYVLHFGLTTDGKLSIGGWASNPANMYALTSTAAVPLGQWSHVAMSWSSSGARIYINGALSASSNQSWQPAGPQYAYLNYWGSAALGALDELHISKVQRSDAEIAAHASGGCGCVGVQGPAGPAGPKGDVGPAGPTGSKGAQGPQGPKGDTGSQGAAGPQGASTASTLQTVQMNYRGSINVSCPTNFFVIAASCNAGANTILNGASPAPVTGSWASYLTPNAGAATGVHCDLGGSSLQSTVLLRCSK